MRSRCLLLLAAVLLCPFSVSAQKCSEGFIQSNINNEDWKLLTKDTYFFSGALEKPIVGIQESKKTEEKGSPERKNEKWDPNKLDRVVVSPSGDMAYAYGTQHARWDDASNGKHLDFTAAFLMVWRVADGSCKVAAAIYEPEGNKD
jgi:ketosteroid isomerase-like protein